MSTGAGGRHQPERNGRPGMPARSATGVERAPNVATRSAIPAGAAVVPAAGAGASAVRARQEMAALGARLRHLREDAQLSGRGLAERAGWSPSKVSRIEHGAQLPSAADIHAWCEAAGRAEVADEVVAAMRVVDSLFTEWNRQEATGLTVLQTAVVPQWDRTRAFRFYALFVIPTPLQTADYAHALLSYVQRRRATVDDIDQAVEARMARQERALANPACRFSIVVEEAALTYAAGTPEVMAAQLGHLLVLAARPRVSVGIIPAGTDRSFARPVEGFCLFDDHTVDLELVAGSVQFTQPHVVAMYGAFHRDLSTLAVRGPDARAIINRAIAAVDQ